MAKSVVLYPNLPKERGQPPYLNMSPEELKSWKPVDEPSKEVELFITEVKSLKKHGLSGLKT